MVDCGAGVDVLKQSYTNGSHRDASLADVKRRNDGYKETDAVQHLCIAKINYAVNEVQPNFQRLSLKNISQGRAEVTGKSETAMQDIVDSGNRQRRGSDDEHLKLRTRRYNLELLPTKLGSLIRLINYFEEGFAAENVPTDPRIMDCRRTINNIIGTYDELCDDVLHRGNVLRRRHSSNLFKLQRQGSLLTSEKVSILKQRLLDVGCITANGELKAGCKPLLDEEASGLADRLGLSEGTRKFSIKLVDVPKEIRSQFCLPCLRTPPVQE